MRRKYDGLRVKKLDVARCACEGICCESYNSASCCPLPCNTNLSACGGCSGDLDLW